MFEHDIGSCRIVYDEVLNRTDVTCPSVGFVVNTGPLAMLGKAVTATVKQPANAKLEHKAVNLNTLYVKENDEHQTTIEANIDSKGDILSVSIRSGPHGYSMDNWGVFSALRQTVCDFSPAAAPNHCQQIMTLKEYVKQNKARDQLKAQLGLPA